MMWGQQTSWEDASTKERQKAWKALMLCTDQDTRSRRWQTGGVFGIKFSLGVNHSGVWVWGLPPPSSHQPAAAKGFIIQPADAR